MNTLLLLLNKLPFIKPLKTAGMIIFVMLAAFFMGKRVGYLKAKRTVKIKNIKKEAKEAKKDVQAIRQIQTRIHNASDDELNNILQRKE